VRRAIDELAEAEVHLGTAHGVLAEGPVREQPVQVRGLHLEEAELVRSQHKISVDWRLQADTAFLMTDRGADYVLCPGASLAGCTCNQLVESREWLVANAA
jgi:hypothetical protein